MCGIIGVAGLRVQDGPIELALLSMQDRGPDASSSKIINSALTLGATRLAMVDPHPRSNQPFFDEISGDCLIFNGEIYNFLVLRDELKNEFKDLTFRTESDTEVLLIGLQLKGSDFVNSLNGMFSFAFYSKKDDTVLLGRDLQGKKPLYYHESSEGIVWASSLKAIRLMIESGEISNLEQYLQLGYFVDPDTPYRNVKELIPGSLLKYELSHNKITHLRISEAKSNRRMNSHPSQLRDALKVAVSNRIKDQNKVAISLSGGVDSAVIAILLAELGADTTAYSSHWEDKDKEKYNSDSKIAERIAKNLGIEFKKIAMPTSIEIRDVLTDFLQAMQEPNNNPTGLSMMFLYRGISKDKIRLVLTGDGSDEILAGYDRYNKTQVIPKLFDIRETNSTRSVANLLARVNPKAHKLFLSQFELQSTLKWLQWHQLFAPHEYQRIIGKMAIGEGRQTPRYLQSLSYAENLMNPVESLMRFDSKIWLAMESNRKLDRVSMSFSLEARCPFQDLEVKDAARELMTRSKYRNLNKKLLWEAFPELIDLNVRTDKFGFISPVGHWLRGNPDLVAESIDYLCKNFSSDRIYLEKLGEGVRQGDFRRIQKTWAVVVLARWLAINAE
jgi:asparagine synthase (glutamine-hydrolysing)